MTRYDIAQVIADSFDLIVSDIVTGQFTHFKNHFEADDLDMMELAAKLEDEFDIKIPPEVEQSWCTVEDVYRFMESQ